MSERLPDEYVIEKMNRCGEWETIWHESVCNEDRARNVMKLFSPCFPNILLRLIKRECEIEVLLQLDNRENSVEEVESGIGC
jgi:hypothetical protein